jgi:ATP-dependent Clp protease adaptor protein ClpS
MTTTARSTTAIAETQPARRPAERPQPPPRYHVVLLDDNDHTYEYVVEMLRKLFGTPSEGGFQLACEVDRTGRVIVDTTTLERAELKRDQIHAFGRDWRIPRCQGSMTSLVELAPR